MEKELLGFAIHSQWAELESAIPNAPEAQLHFKERNHQMGVLNMACFNNCPSSVALKLLAKGLSVHDKRKHTWLNRGTNLVTIHAKGGETPLYTAAARNAHPGLVRILLEEGGDPNSRTDSGETPVHAAAYADTHPDLVRMLLGKGGDPNRPNDKGRTPVHYAAQTNVHPDMMRTLLDKGGDPNRPSKDGITPLFLATQQNVNPDLVEVLLSKGGDPNRRTVMEITPVYMAAFKNVHPDLMRKLLDKGGDPNRPDESGLTPVHVAVHAKVHPDLMRLLLDKGGDANRQGKEGNTPIYDAARNDANPDLMEVLLSRGGDPNTPENSGWTPLLVAAHGGSSYDLAKLLLDYGADPTKKFNGKTPLMWAELQKHAHLLRLLKNPPSQTKWPSARSTSPSRASLVVDDLPQATESKSTSTSEARREHLVVFSYVRKDCAGEVLTLAEKAAVKFPGKPVLRDSDMPPKLDEILDNLNLSKNVVVLLSASYARRPFTLVELHTALTNGANVVSVKATRPGRDQFDFEQVQEDIKSGAIANYLDSEGWSLLAEYKMNVDTVAKDLLAVMNLRTHAYDVGCPKRVVEEIFDSIVQD